MSLQIVQKAKIENWGFILDPASLYSAPEEAAPRLVGDVRDHPRIGSRDSQTTSRIMGKTKDGLVVTRNTAYELGSPNEQYESQFPNSFQRLMEQLPEVEVVIAP